VISDEVTTSLPSSINFNLHTYSQINITDDTIRFEDDKADLMIKVIAPESFTTRTSSIPDASGHGRLNALHVGTEKTTSAVNFLTVLYPLRKGGQTPSITSETNTNGTTIRVDSDVIEWSPKKGLALK